MNWLKKIFGTSWISCKERLPDIGKTVRIKYKNWESIGYISPYTGLWQDLAANAMSIDFDKGILVEYWKEHNH